MFKVGDKIIVYSPVTGYLREKGTVIEINKPSKGYKVKMHRHRYTVWFDFNEVRLDIIQKLKDLKCSK